MWKDHRGPPPPEDEPMEPDLAVEAEDEEMGEAMAIEPGLLLGEPQPSFVPEPPVLPVPLHHPSMLQQPMAMNYSPVYNQRIRQDVQNFLPFEMDQRNVRPRLHEDLDVQPSPTSPLSDIQPPRL